MYLLGFDIGSSSVKAALVAASSGETIAFFQSPDDSVMPILAPAPGWAEQDPEMWWLHVCHATQMVLEKSGINPEDITGIGIAYQMHGLVCLDKRQKVLRPSIIWCDSRAVVIGDQAFNTLGRDKCLNRLLNSPGNFTASKLKWVEENEPALFERIDSFLLPGDYIAMKLSGFVQTTAGGLSEGILWDFSEEAPATFLLDHYNIDRGLLPEIVPAIGFQAKVSEKAAKETGLVAGTPICYRAGDQPNNAMSLGVLSPGEVAATAGTSGVIYGVTDEAFTDGESRVNSFLHVNHTALEPRIGTLLCINGAGIMHNWIKEQVAQAGMTYQEMEAAAGRISIGSNGLVILPFGNGAERIFGNLDPGARIMHLQLNRHRRDHFYRAGLEGIAFAFAYGAEILDEIGITPDVIRVGNDNLFRSGIFSDTLAHVLDVQIEVFETTGAVGAARAAGVATGVYQSVDEAMEGTTRVKTYTPDTSGEPYEKAYEHWLDALDDMISNASEVVASLN